MSIFNRKQKRIDSIMIKEFGYKNNTLDITMQHPEFVTLTKGLVKYFKESGGINYVEVGTYHPELGPFVVTVQRKHGKTPAQLTKEARDDRDQWKRRCEAAERLIHAMYAEDEDTVYEEWQSIVKDMEGGK